VIARYRNFPAGKSTAFDWRWQQSVRVVAQDYYVKHVVIVFWCDYFLANNMAIGYGVAPAGGAPEGLRETLGT
jgi:hypothetical protein